MHPSWPHPLRVAVAVATVSLAACHKPVANEEPTDVEPQVVVQSTPVATPVAAAPVPTPEPDYFAPPGVYFLTTAASVETPEGIVGLKPGTRLQKVAPGTYTADGHQLELRDAQVTNDLRIAQRVAGADHGAQMALRQAMKVAEAQAAKTARTSSATTPSATPNTIVAGGQPSRSTAPRAALGSSLGSGGTFGRTRTKDGWIWQLDSRGDWQPIRPDK